MKSTVAETYPEMIISDGECTMICKIDNTTIKSTDLDLKNLNLKGKYKLLYDLTLELRKRAELQTSVYENEIVKNLIRYTRHKMYKNRAGELNLLSLKMPSVADVNSKENQDIAEIISVGMLPIRSLNTFIIKILVSLEIPIEKAQNSVITISGFLKPTENDFNLYLNKLVPLKYSDHKEVELETPESIEEKQLKLQLGKIKDGLTLANILVELHEENFDADEFLNNSCESGNNSDVDVKEEVKNAEVVEETKEVEPTYVNPKIDGYSQDE